jgi:CRP/FNR family transcriptional regulator, cyclic AMP receptor protein
MNHNHFSDPGHNLMYDIIISLLETSEFKNHVKFKVKQFKANAKILHQGEKHSHIYLIKNGSVRVTITSKIREDSSLKPGIADLSSSDFFGEFGLFDELPASADVKALVDSELIEIDIPSFKRYLETNPDISSKIYLSIIKTLVQRLRKADIVIYKLYAWGMQAHNLDKFLE